MVDGNAVEGVRQLLGVASREPKGANQLVGVPPGGLVADSCLGREVEVDILE